MSEPLSRSVHPDAQDHGRCRRCGQPVGPGSLVTREGVILCQPCLDARRWRRVKILAVVSLMVGAPAVLAAWVLGERLSGHSWATRDRERIRPESSDAHQERLRRAEHLERTGRAAEARAELGRILKDRPHHPGALHALARLDRAAGDWEAVLRDTGRILVKHPGAVEARQWQAEALVSLGKPDRAERALRDGLARIPRSGVLALALARLLAASNRRGEALDLLRQAIKRRPDSEEAELHTLLLSLEKEPR